MNSDETVKMVRKDDMAVVTPEVIRLFKKMKKLFRKYERFEKTGDKKSRDTHKRNAFSIPKARILKAAEATQRKLDKLGFTVS
jgi:hypothetical protein